MSFPHSHKTVIVLDRSPHFLHSSKQNVEFDVFTKSRTPGIIPLAPIVKSLWTCSVEAAIEYCRIVYDVYPQNKLIRLVLSDTVATTVNSWEQHQQNIQKLMLTLARQGPPTQASSRSDENNIMNGLTEAVRLLCQPTTTQHDRRTTLSDSPLSVANRGRIICLTNLKSDSHIRKVEECVQDVLTQRNSLAASTDNLMPLSHLELVLVHVVPVSHESTITHKPGREISSHLWSEVHVSQSGRFIATKMVELSMQHFQLSCTTVTGIPMKEEQNASSSANYDVELLHSRQAHLEVSRTGVGAVEGMIMPSKEGLFVDTVTLKWCTPRTNAVELHPCHGAFRITPVDVNSRPSSCLTNFLLNGRSVMLEQPRKTGNKVISHMLTSHGGEIYIHILMTSRSILEDPPSISEGSGGRVTDYRINDFGEMMRQNWLAPVADISGFDELPIQRAKGQLERMTRHWPLVISDTIIFNLLPQVQPLPSVIIKETMTDSESLECKKAIYRLVSMESKNEPLPVPPSGTRGKGPKREEQYRQMWAELEKFVRAHAGSSVMHQKVLECVLECKKPSADDGHGASPSGEDRKPSLLELEQAAWKELDRYEKTPERRDTVKVETPASPPPTKRIKSEKPHSISRTSGHESLLSLWTSRLKAQHSNHHAEFAGRSESTGHKADLYIHLNDNPKGDMKNGGLSGKTSGIQSGKLGCSASGGLLKKY